MNCIKKLNKLKKLNLKNNNIFIIYLHLIDNRYIKFLCSIEINNNIILKTFNKCNIYILSTLKFEYRHIQNINNFIKFNPYIIEVITIKKKIKITTYNKNLLLMNKLHNKYKNNPCIICLNYILCKNKFKCNYCKNKFLCEDCSLNLKLNKYNKCPICTNHINHKLLL